MKITITDAEGVSVTIDIDREDAPVRSVNVPFVRQEEDKPHRGVRPPDYFNPPVWRNNPDANKDLTISYGSTNIGSDGGRKVTAKDAMPKTYAEYKDKKEYHRDYWRHVAKPNKRKEKVK